MFLKKIVFEACSFSKQLIALFDSCLFLREHKVGLPASHVLELVIFRSICLEEIVAVVVLRLSALLVIWKHKFGIYYFESDIIMVKKSRGSLIK